MVIGTYKVGGALAKFWIFIVTVHTAYGVQYLGKFIGKLSELEHGVSGEVYAVDARTLHIKSFTYDGQGPAAYFYAGSTRAPSNAGFRLRDENGRPDVIRKYRGESITLTLPEGKTLANIRWFSVWCEEFSVNFGDVKIPENFDYPRPQKIEPLNGVHGISSDDIVIVDAQTLLIPHLSYDGEAPDAKFWVGRGPKPSPQGIRVPDENGKEVPLRKYDRKTVVLTLPGDLTIFDIGHFGIWCEAFTVDFGHVQIPSNLNIPPSLKMLGVSPQSKLNCEILLEERAFEVRWAVAGESIVLQLVAKLDNGEYMSFGLSGEDHASVMLGGDIVVAWVNKESYKGYADDYYLQDKSQCSGYTGSCPDQLLQDGADAVRVLNAALVNGYSIVTYQRTLLPHDRFDRQIFTNQSQPIIWAIGPLNQRNQVSYHSKYTKGNHFIDFGRPPKWNCPSPESEESRSASRQRANRPAQRQRPYEVPRKEVEQEDRQHSHEVSGKEVEQEEVLETTLPPSPRPTHRRRGDARRRIVNNGNNQAPAPVARQPIKEDSERINPAANTRPRQAVSVVNEDIQKTNPAPQRTRQTRRRNGGEGRGRGDTRNGDYRNTNVERQTTTDAPRRLPPTPAPAERVEPWHIPAIQCYEPEDGVFYAQMGPTGGKKGYPAITGHVGWGISWYINGLLIPEINVVRGKTYTFVVEGGDDENAAAKYHPFYITDDPVGGYAYKTDEERKSVHIFAGAVQLSDGTIKPTGTGRLCHWTYKGDLDPEDYPSFGAYQRSLELKCEQGEPGIVQWTPDRLTPDTVYYQCFTHRYLGWKINVLDSCDELSQGSEFHPSIVLPPKDFHEHTEDDLESDATYRVATIVKIPPGLKNQLANTGVNETTLEVLSNNATNTKELLRREDVSVDFHSRNSTFTQPMYVSHPNSLISNQRLIKPLFYAAPETQGPSFKPLRPSPSVDSTNPPRFYKPLYDSIHLNSSIVTMPKPIKLSTPTLYSTTTDSSSPLGYRSSANNQYRKRSHVVKKMIRSSENEMKEKQTAKRPIVKIIKRPATDIVLPFKLKTRIDSKEVEIEEKPKRTIINIKMNKSPKKIKEPFVEVSPIQPSTERISDMSEDEYYLEPKYLKMQTLRALLLSEKLTDKLLEQQNNLKTTTERFTEDQQHIHFISTPSPGENATTLVFASNTGFDPKSIVLEGGFKPMKPTDPPRILKDIEGPKVESESEIGVLKVPIPSDTTVVTHKNFISRRSKDSTYDVKPFEIRIKRQRSNVPKYLPYEDSLPESAEHISSYYLPPNSDKKVPVDDTKQSGTGVFVTYDGKKIPGSTLTARLDENNNVLRQKNSKAADFIKSRPQFAPFKGDLPPLDQKFINSHAARAHQASLNLDLQSPNLSSSNSNQSQGAKKLKLLHQSTRSKREAHHTPEHTAEQMALSNNSHSHNHEEHISSGQPKWRARADSFIVSLYCLIIVISYQRL